MGNAAFYNSNGNMKRIRNMKHKLDNVLYKTHKSVVLGAKTLLLDLRGEDFKNSPASVKWLDRSGNGNDFTPEGIEYTASSGSDGNGSVVLDGINDRLRGSTNLNITGPFILEITFAWLDSVDGPVITNFQSAGFGIGIAFNSDYPGKICGTIYLGGYKTVYSDETIIAGVEYHAMLVYTGEALELYVNNVKQASTLSISGAFKQSVYGLALAENPGGGALGGFFKLKVRNVKLYSLSGGNARILL